MQRNDSVRRRELISVRGAFVGRVLGVKESAEEQQNEVVRLRGIVGIVEVSAEMGFARDIKAPD